MHRFSWCCFGKLLCRELSPEERELGKDGESRPPPRSILRAIVTKINLFICTKKKKSKFSLIRLENRAIYNETWKHFQIMKATKQETWRNKWREFWSGDPREIWHFIRQLMGRGGSECECHPEEISAHFSDVGKPPDDPDFCMNCPVEAQHWIAENF